MARVNAKILTLKHELFKRLKDSLEKDKEAIKNGAEITFKDYCKIDIVDCKKSTLDETKVQALCNEYGIDIETLKKTTHYKRLDIKNVPTEVNDKVEDIFNMLQDSNDKVITKTASIMVNKAASKR